MATDAEEQLRNVFDDIESPPSLLGKGQAQAGLSNDMNDALNANNHVHVVSKILCVELATIHRPFNPNSIMSLTLLFIRHGETQDNIDLILQGWRDTSLTSKGHKEAATVAAKLTDIKIDAIYHSPLVRITQTLAPVLQSHPDIKPESIHADPDLRGQGLGDLEGGSYDLVDMGNPRSADGGPGVEDFDDFVRRLKRSLGRIVGREAPLIRNGGGDRTVVIASHGVSITSIFKMLEGTTHCAGFLSQPVAVRGSEAWEVRYPESDDVARVVVKDAGGLPVRDGEVVWDEVDGRPFVIEFWGKKEKAL